MNDILAVKTSLLPWEVRSFKERVHNTYNWGTGLTRLISGGVGGNNDEPTSSGQLSTNKPNRMRPRRGRRTRRGHKNEGFSKRGVEETRGGDREPQLGGHFWECCGQKYGKWWWWCIWENECVFLDGLFWWSGTACRLDKVMCGGNVSYVFPSSVVIKSATSA